MIKFLFFSKKSRKSPEKCKKEASRVGISKNAKKCGFFAKKGLKNSIFLYAADPFAKNGLAVHTPGGRGQKKSIFWHFF
jgi:hypothetical protein